MADKIEFGEIQLNHPGEEIARSTKDGDWLIRVDGEYVSLKSIIDSLVKVFNSLESMKND